MYEICGPFTLPLQPKVHLLTLILLMETFRIYFPKAVDIARRVPLLKSWAHLAQEFISIKYALVLLLKITLIFENDHRKKFYLHTLLLEGTIMIMCIVLDCFHRTNVPLPGYRLQKRGSCSSWRDCIGWPSCTNSRRPSAPTWCSTTSCSTCSCSFYPRQRARPCRDSRPPSSSSTTSTGLW